MIMRKPGRFSYELTNFQTDKILTLHLLSKSLWCVACNGSKAAL